MAHSTETRFLSCLKSFFPTLLRGDYPKFSILLRTRSPAIDPRTVTRVPTAGITDGRHAPISTLMVPSVLSAMMAESWSSKPLLVWVQLRVSRVSAHYATRVTSDWKSFHSAIAGAVLQKNQNPRWTQKPHISPFINHI